VCPRRRISVCAARTDCRVPQQALTTREARTVDAGTALEKATAGAWKKEHKGQVICVPPPPHQCVRGAH